jgi:hypothetical protein
MTPGPWETTNQAYLQQGLAWLRRQLPSAAGETPAEGRDTDKPWWSADEWQDPERRPALEALGDLFGLSRFERLLLLLCAGPELDLTIGRRCAEALGDANATGPTLGLALSILPEPTWDAMAGSGPLRAWRLIETHGRPDQPLITAPVRADERIVDQIRGLNLVDSRLDHLCTRLPPILGDPLPASQEAAVTEAVSVWLSADADRPAPILELMGPDPVVRAGLAAEVAARVGFECYELAPERLLSHPDPSGQLRLWRRETCSKVWPSSSIPASSGPKTVPG